MPIIGTLPSNIVNGDIGDAPTAMANWNYIVQQVNANAAMNGANNDITSLLALTTPINPAQGGSSVYYGATSTGTGDYVVTPVTPLGFSLVAGKRVVFLIGNNNTTSTVRLNANGTGLVNVRKRAASGLVTLNQGDWVAGSLAECIYDGTQFVWNENITQGIGPQGTIPSATTTDLGTVASHNVLVSGTTTITGFGNSGNVASPLYLVSFSGALTLTHTGGTLNLPNATNITTVAGDYCWAVFNGTSQWTVIGYMRATGRALTATDPFPSQTGNNFKVLTTDGTNVSWDGKGVTAATTFTGSTGGQFGGAKNIASVVRNTTGSYTLTFTTNLTLNYQVLLTVEDATNMPIWRVTGRAVSGFNIFTTLSNAVPQDFANINVVVIGGL